MIPIFENTKNTKKVFSVNSSLLFKFSVFCVFVYVFQKKKNKLETKFVFLVLLVLHVFENGKQFSKTVNKVSFSQDYLHQNDHRIFECFLMISVITFLMVFRYPQSIKRMGLPALNLMKPLKNFDQIKSCALIKNNMEK